MSTETTTETSKKSFLTRVMEIAQAKESNEITDEQTAVQNKNNLFIKKTVLVQGAVLAGVVAASVALKIVINRMEETAPENEDEITED